MKSRYLLIVLIFVSLLGCRYWGVRGSGDLEEEYRDIGDFSKIEVSGAFSVYVTVGESTSLKIETDDNLLKYIKTRVVGNTLEIYTKKEISPKTKLKVTLTTPELTSIDASGANSIKAKGIFGDRFYIDLSGACNADLEGEIEKLYIDISGAGNCDSRELNAEHVKVDLSGASNADVYASESLDADVSGVGNIDFWGDPENVKTDVSGIGSIDRR